MKPKLTVAGIVLGTLMACSTPTGSSPSDDPEGTDLLKAYGVETNLGSPTDADGNTLPSSYNPLGYRTSTLLSRQEIFVSGVKWDESGAYDGAHAFLIDESASNDYKPMSKDSDDSWAKNPHATAAGDVDGTGYEKTVSVIFYPSGSFDSTNADNEGTAKLVIVSGTSSTYTRKTVSLAGTFHLVTDDESANKYYMTDIALGDIDGDGRDEAAAVIGNTLVILDDANANYKVIKTVDYRGGDYDDHDHIHITTVAAGDLDGDGSDEFIVADGIDESSGADYYVYRGSSADQVAHGVIRANNETMQTAKVAVGDVDGDYQKEVVFAGEQADNNSHYYVEAAKWDGSSSELTFFDCVFSDNFTWGDHCLLPLVCFNPLGKTETPQDLIYVEEHVLQYDDSGTSPAFKKFYDDNDVGEAFRDCVAAGDFNGDGKDELVFPDNDDRDLFIYGLGSSGSWHRLKDPGTLECAKDDDYYPSICAVDVRGNSAVVQFKERDLKFSDPEVIAVLASPPYYSAYVEDVDLGNYSTSIGYSSGSGSSTSKSFSVNASYSVGVSAETPLWGSALSIESKTTIGASFTYTAATSKERTVTQKFSTIAGEDQVVFTCIPIDVYTYTVLRSSDSGAIGDEITINMPRSPQMISMSRDDFNSLPSVPVRIDSGVLTHTIGAPSTYPSSSTISALIKGSTDEGGGLWYPDTITKMSCGKGSGYVAQTVEQTSTSSSTYGVGFSFQVETTIVAGGALFGTSYGFEGEYDYEVSTSEGTAIEGVVPNIPSTASSSDMFNFGVSAYQTTQTGQTAPFLVVTYWVQ